MSHAYSQSMLIDHASLSIEDFKNGYLRNNYNENMFNSDGSLNGEYNSRKKTGIISQIFEDHWNNIPPHDKQNILKFRPNADKEVNKIIDCHNKNLGCSVYECTNCHDFIFVEHTCIILVAININYLVLIILLILPIIVIIDILFLLVLKNYGHTFLLTLKT